MNWLRRWPRRGKNGNMPHDAKRGKRMTDRIRVPSPVLTGLEAMRASERCKLFDVPCVLSWLAVHNYPQTEQWVRNHQDDYIYGVLYGFEVTR